jgi:hypothetical protein
MPAWNLLCSELLRRAGLEGAGEDLTLAREGHSVRCRGGAAAVRAALAHLDSLAPGDRA